jgi:hypothetical protein
MAALIIAAASVLLVEGSVADGQIAGEVINAGEYLYYDDVLGKWFKSECDTTPLKAGASGGGMALSSALAPNARFSVAKAGAIVSIGAGLAGIVYHPGPTLGSLVPTADLVSTQKMTIAGFGIGSSKIKLVHAYDAGAVLA